MMPAHSANPHRRASQRLSLLLACLFMACWSAAHAEEAFHVRHAQIRLEDGSYLLDASIDSRFSAEALEALDHGVPLTIVIHLQVRRARAWLWEDSLLDRQLRLAIRYKPLSERYEVYRLPGERGERSFVTRDAALRALGELHDVQLLDRDRLTADADYEVKLYEVKIKVFLDIEELPLPLRPMAYLKSSWKLSSGWSKWPIAP